MPGMLESIDRPLDRRGFLAASAAAAAALGLSGSLYGCDNKVAPTEETESAEGAWMTMACLHGCGGRCLNKAYVKDGVILRQKTDDTHEDSVAYPQMRGCVRGRALAENQMGADRLKYPMKRKSWTPDDPHGELRGKDEWERISWDEALDIVADQIKKVYTEFGPKAVYKPKNNSRARNRVLDVCGGCLSAWDTVSYGTYNSTVEMMGLPFADAGEVNDRMDLIENAETIVLYAQNPAWSAPGNPPYYFWAAKNRGAQFVYVGPNLSASAAMLDAKWIRVLPGTDTAFLLGVAYKMLELDEAGENLVDWDFLHRCCVGFDGDSMPEGAPTDENFKGYVLGEYDGEPKTPEWASAICGAPVEDFEYFARAVGKDVKAVLSHGYGAARCNGAEDFPQLYMTIACMGGHFGKSGHACGNYFVDNCGDGGPALVVPGEDGLEDDFSSLPPLCDPADSRFTMEGTDKVGGCEKWDAVLEGKYTNIGDCWGDMLPQDPQTCDIHFIDHKLYSMLRSTPATVKGHEAYRKVDFVVSRHFVANPDSAMADVILPLVSDLERDQLLSSGDGSREMLLYYPHIVEPSYEAKTDQWIDEQLLERLGYDPSAVYPISEKQQLFNKLSGAQVMNEQGEYETLLTITDEDIAAWGAEGTAQEGRITLAEFTEKGIFQVERASADDAYRYIGYEAFVKDPEKNPLASESGKFEIYCQKKAEALNNVSYGESYKPYPTYHEYAAEEGYPFWCYSPKYLRTACTDYGNTPRLREAWAGPAFISVEDAEAKGVKTGDPLLISSPYGKIVREASVMNTVMPGTLGLPGGGWPEFDENGIDLGGNQNVLYGAPASGSGVSGYNNVSVDFEKWDGTITPDCERQLVIEDASEEA